MSIEALRETLAVGCARLAGKSILVLAGGSSAEREVSLTSGQAVFNALSQVYKAELYRVEQGSVQEAIDKIRQSDIVFTTMHGTMGEDGVWQGLFDLLDIPYVSAGVKGSVLAMDKLVTKRLFCALGIPTPKFWIMSQGSAIRSSIPLEISELVAKPLNQGSSIGVMFATNSDEGWRSIEKHNEQYNPLLIEERIHGSELTIGVIGIRGAGHALAPVMIKPHHEFYDYSAKYTQGGSEYICPAPLPPMIADSLKSYSTAIFHEFDLAPYARVDCILDLDGKPQFLEANTLPGFTPFSLLPMGAKAEGVEFLELLQLLLACALLRHEQKDIEHAQ